MPRVKGRKPMRERRYRASRLCRVIGSPLAYDIVRRIGSGVRTPTELAGGLNATVYAVSVALRMLRQIDVVRYETDGNRKRYWLKHPELIRVLTRLEKVVDKMRWTQQ
jgi:hypothetical protein